MKLPRRNFLHLAAGAAALPAVSRIASAQTYPVRPVRIIVGLPAGGGADITARIASASTTARRSWRRPLIMRRCNADRIGRDRDVQG